LIAAQVVEDFLHGAVPADSGKLSEPATRPRLSDSQASAGSGRRRGQHGHNVSVVGDLVGGPGSHLSKDFGATVAQFPMSQLLRHATPFSSPL